MDNRWQQSGIDVDAKLGKHCIVILSHDQMIKTIPIPKMAHSPTTTNVMIFGNMFMAVPSFDVTL